MKKSKVLIADANLAFSAKVIKAIERHTDDLECMKVSEAEEVVPAARDFRPDIIVLGADSIGSMSGLDVLQRLREENVVNGVPVILTSPKDNAPSALKVFDLGADDLLIKPFDVTQLILKIKAILRMIKSASEVTATELEKRTIRALGKSVEVKDRYTEGHSARVAFYSVMIGSAMILPKAQLSLLEDSAYLHDLGKIGISEEILNKAGKLTAEEYTIIKTHPVKSANIIEALGFLKEIIPAVLHHHEQYDGGGYPDGLKGEDIPIHSRIILVSDAFDTMTSDRSYRKGLGTSTALEELKRFKGKQFDPQIADVFMGEIRKYPGIDNFQKLTGAESLALLKKVKG